MLKTIQILKFLKKSYPEATCSLNYKNPFQLLVAVILSAQCTDVRVNKITPELFKKLPNAKAFANEKIENIEKEIKSCGFYRNKARSVQGSAISIVENYKNKVPNEMKELIKLPGVGRKTANVILGTAYGKNEGITVDTHVSRLSQRWKITKNKTPEKIEQDLMKLMPKKEWTFFGHATIWHGRNVCKAQKPLCDKCGLNKKCPSAFKV